ncbi:MAG: Na+/H+ antiporter subunit D [Mogibacterium sp.]|nr:Na+/H+ antiporter subunit D [Mogibacterium sp.]MBR2540652.1 Na+/H+ antiporter subunit D [Mogibacterium sp.]
MTGLIMQTIKDNLHPGLIMMGFGILVMLLPRPCRKLLGLIAPLTATWALFQMSETSSLRYDLASYIHMEFIHYDSLSFAFMLAFCIIAVLNGFYGEGIQHRYECGMSLMYAGSVMGVVLAGDCISLIIFWEISAFASMYVIYSKHDRVSARASFRYILVHGFGGNMLLAGLIIYMFHYGNSLENITSCYGEPCFWLIATGVAVNAAIPPLHAWLPDAYPESTATGTVYLSSFTTKAAIYLMIRMFSGLEALVWIGAIVSIYAACMAIMENGIRRLLAYHIISQLGMMIAAIGAGGALGADAATAHAITNIMFKGVLMMGAGAVIYATGKSNITELGGMAKKMPVTAACFLISSLAIAGLPGLSGFVSKALVMDALHEGGYTIPALLVTAGGVGTLLSITLKINWFVFFGPCDDPEESKVVRKIPVTMGFAMIMGTVVTILIGVMPEKFYSLMPYATIVEPYHMGHVLEYIAIFIGGSIPFFLYLKKMKPHDEVTIDFDWFYRKPFNDFMLWLSKLVERIFAWCDRRVSGAAGYLRTHFGDPTLWTASSRSVRIRKFSFENESRLIGDVLSAIVIVFIIMMIGAAVVMR